ncbi:YdeI/OmpD-associated family protein [bacterium]|nr:YdeI/OmpD-associated family protein [bacterium]
MKSIDQKTYKKYFSKRKDTKKWSGKNIAIYEKSLKTGLVANAGVDAYKTEKNDDIIAIDINVKIEILKKELKQHKDILCLFESKAPSRQKQFAVFYCDAKTEETRKKRIDKIIKALVNNYKGMLY